MLASVQKKIFSKRHKGESYDILKVLPLVSISIAPSSCSQILCCCESYRYITCLCIIPSISWRSLQNFFQYFQAPPEENLLFVAEHIGLDQVCLFDRKCVSWTSLFKEQYKGRKQYKREFCNLFSDVDWLKLDNWRAVCHSPKRQLDRSQKRFIGIYLIGVTSKEQDRVCDIKKRILANRLPNILSQILQLTAPVEWTTKVCILEENWYLFPESCTIPFMYTYLKYKWKTQGLNVPFDWITDIVFPILRTRNDTPGQK